MIIVQLYVRKVRKENKNFLVKVTRKLSDYINLRYSFQYAKKSFD